MKQTPHSNRKKIVLWGRTNVGKSSLLNALTEQQVAIVSNYAGTTTDPVRKAMELLELGAVLFVDTAGMDDNSLLGREREERTLREVETADLVLLTIDSTQTIDPLLTSQRSFLADRSIPFIEVFTQIDRLMVDELEKLRKENIKGLFVSIMESHSISLLRDAIQFQLQTQEPERSFLQGFSFPNRKLLMVIPIDSEAPKGRLILPQVQLLREALDEGLQVVVVRDSEMDEVFDQSSNFDLVVCDSQVFKRVYDLNGGRFPLTSFSILYARQKGEIDSLMVGARNILSLPDRARILIAETCTHTTSHEDIGRVKIPKLLEKLTGKQFDIHYSLGMDFPEDLRSFDLIIHCGGCMLTRRQMVCRQQLALRQGVPITNYGLTIALCCGILEKVKV